MTLVARVCCAKSVPSAMGYILRKFVSSGAVQIERREIENLLERREIENLLERREIENLLERRDRKSI